MAEALIVLGIIGTIAILTMPGVIQSYKKYATTSRLKKFYGEITEAVLLSETQNDKNVRKFYIDDEYKTDCGSHYSVKERYALSVKYYNHYLAPYLKSVKMTEGTMEDDTYYFKSGTVEENSDRPTVYFNDGSSLTLWLGSAIDLLYDVNGTAGPNELGRDQFLFFIATSISTTHVPDNLSVSPAHIATYDTREKALAACKTTPYHCAALLGHDHFEFKKDYPYRL